MRLRITPSELEVLQRNEIVRERLCFAGNETGWSAAILPGVAETSAQLVAGSLLVRLSSLDRAQLSDPANEGVYFQVDSNEPIDSNDSNEHSLLVRYYIEKDFPCVHPRAMEALEPQTETFEAPEDFAERKI